MQQDHRCEIVWQRRAQHLPLPRASICERTWTYRVVGPLIVIALLGVVSCSDDRHYAKVLQIEEMSQVIGGPAAVARPGDYLLENDRLRAVIHGRRNQRSTLPLANGSLVDLDVQRPWEGHQVGQGRDAFYELGPMADLKLNGSAIMAYGSCEEIGSSPCVQAGCVRVTASGKGENLIGLLGLLDMGINRSFNSKALEMTTDYDVCPGEPFVRVTTTLRYGSEPGSVIEMEELKQQTGLMDVLLGEHTGVPCEAEEDCNAGETCASMLAEIAFGDLNTRMRRCRKPEHRLAGVLTGDFIFFSGKVKVFIEGNGFDHESYIRSVFDIGGDVFGAPLARPFVAGVNKDVSYAYFNQQGQMMVPVFSEAFTASMSNRFACTQQEADCMSGKELRFRRYVSVGDGDIASALAGFYQVRGIPTGQVEGHVLDQRTLRPLSQANIFVFALPQSWQDLADGELSRRSYTELTEALRDETSSEDNPLGAAGPISHFLSDRSRDRIPDGSFDGPLPEGRYLLISRTDDRPTSALVPIRVSAGQTTRATLLAGDAGVLQYQIQDQAGQSMPAKLTIGHCFAECARNEDCGPQRPVCDLEMQLCLPEGGYAGPASCRPDQVWGHDPILQQETCRCPDTGLLPLELGGERMADNTVRVELSPSGKGELRLPPGATAYQVVISRGLEYEISRHFVAIQPGVTSYLKAMLRRVVDTRGWISADFHVHGPNSVDSGLSPTQRVISYAAEGVELLTSTDHDSLTDYSPTIRHLGLEPWIKSQVGVEVSPLDYGHFIGFPLTFNANEELHGAFHWREPVPGAASGENDSELLPSRLIFQKLREIGSLGLEKTVVFVAHFYDHFTFYGVDPWTLEPPFFNLTALFNKVLAKENFSGEFDALEGFNGKNMDVIRRPTYEEIRTYNTELEQLLAESRTWSYAARQRRWGQLSAAAQRRFLHRTKEEQELALHYANPDFACRCMSDSECGPGGLCDADRATCIAGCQDDEQCNATLVAAQRERCIALSGGDQRRTCQRVTQPCTGDADCALQWQEGDPESTEKCLAVDPAQPAARVCELSCTKDSDCEADPLRPRCDEQLQVCRPATVTAAGPLDPCPTLRGTVDDWFQMLNHGVRRAFLGNSDSHGTYGIEGGIPRNYVRSSADVPLAIDTAEIAEHVKAGQSYPTYGPFIEFSIHGQGQGSVVAVPAGQEVTLQLKVQSPLWFDVDRLEVYRNGSLITEISSSTSCPPMVVDCIKVPNDQVVNFEGKLTDRPERDSWYVVVALGLDGKSLAPVYSSTPVPRLGMYEFIQRLAPLLPPLRSFRIPLSPSMTVVRPYAITNPIWVDVGGDGVLEPPEPLPSWATPADRGLESQKSGLKQTPALEAAAHDHRHGLGALRRQAQQQEQLFQQGVLSKELLEQAMKSLRYYGR